MGELDKTIERINQKIAAGQAKVFTASELLENARRGLPLCAADLDVVTLSFSSGLAGCAVMLLVPVAGRGVFTRARRIWLNGVEGFPGPAPNERLGLVDTLIFSEQASRDGTVVYHGADLILDLLGGSRIEVECITEEGYFFTNSFRLAELQFARMYTYNSRIPTMAVDHPAQDDAAHTPWEVLRAGDKVLLNQAEGIIIGAGTRSGPKTLSLSLAADLFAMDVKLLRPPSKGGDGLGHNTIAMPIPVFNDQTLEAITRYVLGQAGQDPQLQPGDRESALDEFLKQEILARRFQLADSALTLGQGDIG